ncbi:MAG: FtsX-like permease family protein [Clostridiales bacterium]|nr:FtsX-like permease family protein [Clostridiales bacterium]
MSRALLTDILRTIRHSMSRFISIIIIVALGTGFFVGVKSAGPSMMATATEYFIDNNLMDLRIQSTIGLTEDDLTDIKNIDGVSGAMGAKFVDALVLVNGSPEIDIDGSQISTRAYSIDLLLLHEYYYGGDNSDFINRPTLLEGSYPTASNQCLVDASELSTPESYQIGSTITLEEDGNSDLSGLTVTEFEIVGIIESPYYLSYERGNSLVGSGKIGTYIYIPESAFSTDYYSEIYVTVDGASNYDPYSDEYEDYISGVAEKIEQVADTNVVSRVEYLSETLPEEIASATDTYNTTKASVEEALAEAEETIALYQKYVDDPEGSYNEAVNEAAEALGLAEDEFNGNQSAYYDAVESYNQLLEAYKAAKEEQTEKYSEWSKANSAYQNVESQVTAAQTAISSTQQLISSTQTLIDGVSSVLTALEEYQNGQISDSQLAQVLDTLKNINSDLYNSIASLSAVSLAMEAVSLITPYLDTQKAQLASLQATLDEENEELEEAKTQLQAAALVLSAAKAEYDASEVALNEAYEQLNDYYDELQGTQSTLSMKQIELMLSENSVSNDLELLKTVIANASTYLEQAQTAYNEQKAAAETQLAEAEKQINSAQSLLDKLDSASWNIYDRSDTAGYSSYESAVNNVRTLSNIFPVIFFLVAALVCLTTMSRMVEEERTQMGTLKALGYSSSAIILKYVLYSLFASLIGSAIGIVIGVYALPYAIFEAYSIMFSMPDLIFEVSISYILIGMGISLLTTLLASIISAVRELYVKPAALMRPKAPAPGKRVFLERIKFIWRRMKFSSKVTIRNLFRKKTRFVMTILGIAGCTALILASIGLYTSINDLMKKQYDSDGISQYDIQLVFSENQNEDSALMQLVSSDSRITSIMLSSMQSVTGGSGNSEKTEDVYLFVPKDASALSSYIKLQNRSTGNTLELSDSGAIVTEKFADDMNVSVGDCVWVELADGTRVDIPVAGITENYTFSYIYLTVDLYQYLFQEEVTYNYAIGTVSDTVLSDSVSSNNEETQKARLSTDLMSYEGINAVSYTDGTVDALNEVIGVLSIIIIIFIAAAAILAFVVLYNLSNINVEERQRELATIKVLGFHDKEVSAYVYRESIVMTFIGIILGLVLGIFVHQILITYCSVDTVMFVQTLTWYDYVIAAVLTMLFALIVNFIMHKKMKKIDMVESLKSVE